jgi:hypothetical protein
MGGAVCDLKIEMKYKMSVADFPVAPDCQNLYPSSESWYQVWTPQVHVPVVYVHLDEAGEMVVHEGWKKRWSIEFRLKSRDLLRINLY